MGMLEWAKKEVEIASKRERGDKPESEWDYGCACYDSALKAFESLCGDGHSGFSIAMTKQILNRLIEGKPLTPIEDTDDVWNGVIDRGDTYKEYQCNRMSALFKRVHDDGRVTYSDVDRVVCVDIHSGVTYSSGFVKRIIDKKFPITMPYMPTAPYKVYCEDFLTDRKNGDFDTVGIHYMIEPDGSKIPLNLFFKEGLEDWEKISRNEFMERKSRKL